VATFLHPLTGEPVTVPAPGLAIPPALRLPDPATIPAVVADDRSATMYDLSVFLGLLSMVDSFLN
jgi:hypothetical protein